MGNEWYARVLEDHNSPKSALQQMFDNANGYFSGQETSIGEHASIPLREMIGEGQDRNIYFINSPDDGDYIAIVLATPSLQEVVRLRVGFVRSDKDEGRDEALTEKIRSAVMPGLSAAVGK